MKHLSLITSEFIKLAKKMRVDPKRLHKDTGKVKKAEPKKQKKTDNQNKTEEQFLKQYGDKQVRNPDPKGKKKTITVKSLKSRHYDQYKQMFDAWRGGKKKDETKDKKKVHTKKKESKIEKARELRKKEKADIDNVKNKAKEKRNWFNKLPNERQQKYLDQHPASKKTLEKKLKEKKKETVKKPEKEIKKPIEKKKDLTKDEKQVEKIPTNKSTKSRQVVLNQADSNFKKIQQQIKDNAKELKGSVDILSDPHKPSAADVQNLKETTDSINNALKTFGINGSVDNVDIGPRFSSYHVKFDPNQLKNIKSRNTQEKMKLVLKRPDLNISINDRTGTADIETINNKMQNVTFKELVTDKHFIDQAKDKHKTPIILGKDNLGNVTTIDISDSNYSHILIAGGSGSGKSVLSHQIIGSIFYGKSPEDVQMALIDPKKGTELGSYEGSKYLWKPIAKNDNEAIKTFNDIYNESERRYELLAKVGARDLNSFNDLVTKNPKDMTDDEKSKFYSLSKDERKKLSRIVLFADESANLFTGERGKSIVKKAMRIGNIGRAAGVNMLLATQSPQAESIPTKVQNNITTRLTLKLNTRSSAEAVGQPDAVDLLGKGDMLFTDANTGERKRVQTGFISEIESKNIAKEFGATGLKNIPTIPSATKTEGKTVEDKITENKLTKAYYNSVPDEPEELKKFREDMRSIREKLDKQRENIFKMIETEEERSKKLLEPSEESKALSQKLKEQEEQIQESRKNENLSNDDLDNDENDIEDRSINEDNDMSDESIKQNTKKLFEELDAPTGEMPQKTINKAIDHADQIQKLEQKDKKPKRSLTQILKSLFGSEEKDSSKEQEKKSSNENIMNDNEFKSYLRKLDI